MSKEFVVDAFPGFNEIRLAEFRISYLSKLVDKVVIAESSLTQSGFQKRFYFDEWLKQQSSEMQSRVTVIRVPLEHLKTSWEREIHTREFLMEYFRREYPSAKFILSDLDEIPSIEQVEQLRQSSSIFHFQTPTFFRKINWQLNDQHFNWARGVMGQVSLNLFPNGGRFTKSIPWIESIAGGHFSWLGVDQDSIGVKSQAAAHVELNATFWSSIGLIEFCDKYRIDHLGRGRAIGFGIFKILYPLPQGILFELSKSFPDLVDNCEACPLWFIRFWASMKLTTYVGDNRFSHYVRNKFEVEYFLENNSPAIQFFVFIEFLMSMFALTKRAVRKLRVKTI
jgi:hypothetical protein